MKLLLNLFLTAAVFAASSDVLREPEFPELTVEIKTGGQVKGTLWDTKGLEQAGTDRSICRTLLSQQQCGTLKPEDVVFTPNMSLDNVLAAFAKDLKTQERVSNRGDQPSIVEEDASFFSASNGWKWYSGWTEARRPLKEGHVRIAFDATVAVARTGFPFSSDEAVKEVKNLTIEGFRRPDSEKKAQIVKVSIPGSTYGVYSMNWDVSDLSDCLSGQSVWSMFQTHTFEGSKEVNDEEFTTNLAISNGVDKVTGPTKYRHPVFGRHQQVTAIALLKEAIETGYGVSYDSDHNRIIADDSGYFSGEWLWWSGTPKAVLRDGYRYLETGRVRFSLLGENVVIEGRPKTQEDVDRTAACAEKLKAERSKRAKQQLAKLAAKRAKRNPATV